MSRLDMLIWTCQGVDMDRSDETESPVEKARREAGVPLLRLEHKTGIPRSTLRRKIDNPGTLTMDELKRVADALGADAQALFIEIHGGAA